MTNDGRNNFIRTATRKCCSCGEERNDVRNLAALPQKAPRPGTGWGCMTCNLPADGALALVCDRCANPVDPDRNVDIRHAYDGPIGKSELVSIEWLTGRHEHDISKHVGEEFVDE